MLLPTDGEKESKCTRKKRKTPQTHAENKTRKVMKTVTDQGERIAGVIIIIIIIGLYSIIR